MEEKLKDRRWYTMIYHYTSFETFLKILNGIKIFDGERLIELYATHIDKVNDPTEMRISKTQFLELLKAYEEKHKVDCSKSIVKQVSSFEESKFLRVCDSERKEHAPYITCFTKEEDYIPMWSLYGDRAHGVCLCFVEDVGTEVCRGRCKPAFFGDVTYRNNVEADSIRRVLEFYYDSICGKDNDNVYEIIRDMYLGISPFIKNNAYQYESEYRVCIYNFKSERMGTSYSNDKEHISLFLPLTTLKKVILGTKLTLQVTESLLKAYFEKENLDIRIERSKIPFR